MKNILIITIILLSLNLSACGKFDRVLANASGKASEVCQDKVVYLQFSSGASVAYNPDGTIRGC